MEPYLKGTKVLVTDRSEASTLQNKGSFGRPVRGGELHLDLLEAVYLSENDRIDVRDGRKGNALSWTDLLKRGVEGPGPFLGRYMVYRDLRNRGLVVRIGGEGGFLIYPRGTKGLNAKPSGWVHVQSETDKVTLGGLEKKVHENDGMRISTLFSVFDSDWDVTYYNVRVPGIASKVPIEDSPLPGELAGGIDLHPLSGGGAIATKSEGGPFITSGMFGSAVKDILLLSREESFLLCEPSGAVEGGDDRWMTYRALAGKGYRVRSGLKYGCHFRIYTSSDADAHSTHLVQCMDPKRKVSWEELARAIRLCHSVRKRMVYSFISGDGISFLEMEWTRP